MEIFVFLISNQIKTEKTMRERGFLIMNVDEENWTQYFVLKYRSKVP
jgi:hypothetical protein